MLDTTNCTHNDAGADLRNQDSRHANSHVAWTASVVMWLSIYYVHKLDAQRKLMPYVAGYGPGRARPMGPLQRLGRNSAICL